MAAGVISYRSRGPEVPRSAELPEEGLERLSEDLYAGWHPVMIAA
jgi:hypothetical protein